MTKVREATHTVAFVDEYCAQYRALFANVRHFEQFTALHLGLLAETKRKSLAAAGAKRRRPTRRRCITSWPMPSGRWRTCGPSAWSCSWQHWPNGHSSCVLTRPATARRGRPPTTSPTSTSAIWQAGQRGRLGQCLRHPRRRRPSRSPSGSTSPSPASSRATSSRASHSWRSS